MLESFDEGKTARAMRDVTGMILDIKFVDQQTGFIAGSTEPGETRRMRASPRHPTAARSGVRCLKVRAPTTITGSWCFQADRSAMPLS